MSTMMKKTVGKKTTKKEKSGVKTIPKKREPQVAVATATEPDFAALLEIGMAYPTEEVNVRVIPYVHFSLFLVEKKFTFY